MRWALLILLVAPFAAAQPLIVAVVPDLPGSASGEDAVAIASPTWFDLSGFRVTDGESTYKFVNGTVLYPFTPAWFVGNSSLWESFQGAPPVATDFSLLLGNDGDNIELLNPAGSLIDGFAYGTGSSSGIAAPIKTRSPGLIYTRLATNDGWQDTDQLADWQTPRPHRIGESHLDAPTFTVDGLTLYASPDSSFSVLNNLISGAQQRLQLHVYELRSMELVDSFVNAKLAAPALDLQVLVDQLPVGVDIGERHQSADALRRIQASGGNTFLAGHGRYDFHHLKVLIADDAVAIQSENWVPSGVPANPTWGNRGWGVVIHDAQVANWFATWMEADRAAWETKPFVLAEYDPTFEPPVRLPPKSGSYRPVGAKHLVGTFVVTPIVSPDSTQDPAKDPVMALLNSATQRIDAQQLDLNLQGKNVLGWESDDALTGAFVNAQARGVAVRVQLAAPFSQDDTGNAEALDWLSQNDVAGQIFARPPLSTLHNKGLIVDGAVVVGSINANHHSRSENREVSVILHGPGIAAYFEALFDADWEQQEPPRNWSIPGEDLRGLPTSPLPTLLALIGLAWILRSRL